MKDVTTDPQDELLTEVDSINRVIGPIPRGVAHSSPDRIYRTIFVIVKRGKEILLQKRSPTKDLYPDCWDLSVGGHVNYGKSYVETAIKELKEELGIVATEKELRFLGEVLVKLPTSNEFFHVFEFTLDENDDIQIEPDEVSQIRWMTIKDIKESMEKGTLKWYPRPVQVMNAIS